jgi:hypothetical protein
MNKPSQKEKVTATNHIHNGTKSTVKPQIRLQRQKAGSNPPNLPAIFDIREEEKVEGMAWVRVQLEFLSHL